ncbi:MAG: DEAD/DEAH box helicase, partial [Alphaproteobacteria bacterium]|nr:DEAD/DEAH box helicase [Alphaproteobacteria bacterium]
IYKIMMSDLQMDEVSNPVQTEQESNSVETNSVKAYETFDEMELSDDLLRGIFSYGFEKPSSIQQLTIVPMKYGRDILAQSRSGTGKTGAFTIGSLANVDPSLPFPQVIVICPVRELAEQSFKVAQEIGKRLPIKAMYATGGSNLRGDIANLRGGAQYIVGTPGRIYDLIRRGDLCLDYMRYLIFDEADQLLDNLFHDQIMAILKFHFPKSTSLALFSATMPDEVLTIAENFLQNPVRILTPSEEWSLEGIKQFFVCVERDEWKFDVLQDIMGKIKINQALIYVNKRQKAEWLAKKMIDAHHSLEFIHGDMEVQERKKRLNDFRLGQSRVLISTDLLARGIDVQTLSIVINFELPPSRENYLHRIGRTGRYGRKGVSLNIVTEDEMGEMKNIEREYGTTISELPSDLGVL